MRCQCLTFPGIQPELISCDHYNIQRGAESCLLECDYLNKLVSLLLQFSYACPVEIRKVEST